MSEGQSEDKPPKKDSEQAVGEEESIPSDVVLGAGIGILHWLNSDEDEKREEKRWHEQREKDEADARIDARKAENNYELPDGQPYVPKMPYPVPKDWDWRKVKKEEEERRKEDEDRRRWKKDSEIYRREREEKGGVPL